jgi:phage tail protein X
MSRGVWRKALTIPQSGTASGPLNERAPLSSIVDATIIAPGTLTGTVTVQVSHLANPGASDWVPLQRDGSNVTVPVGVATPIAGLFKALRLVSGSAEAADRTFQIVGQSEGA